MTSTNVEFPADEEWLELRGADGYVVSTHGRYYSLRTKQILTAKSRPDGSLRVQIATRKNGKPSSTNRTVPVDVLTHFGPDDGKVLETNGDVACYADGNVNNCRIDNLSWARRGSPEHRASERRVADFERGRMLAEANAAGEAERAAKPKTTSKKSGTQNGRADSAKPGGLVTPEAVRAATANRRTDKDLTPDERKAVREWWVGRGGKQRGRLPADAIMAYDAQHGAVDVGA